MKVQTGIRAGELPPGELTARALDLLTALEDMTPLDASTALTIALSIVLSSAKSQLKGEAEKTCDIFRDALLDQMTRLEGRATLDGRNPV